MKSTTRTVRSLRYQRSDWERINLAVRHYVQKRPLWGIKNPTLEDLAIAYDVSVADIQHKLDEWRGALENFS
jgi:hypothetical protein